MVWYCSPVRWQFFLPRHHPFLGTITHISATSLVWGIFKGVVSLYGGTPNLHTPKCWSFLVGKTSTNPMVVGESHHWMETPQMIQPQVWVLPKGCWYAPINSVASGSSCSGRRPGSGWGWIIWKDLEKIHGNPIRINQFSRLGHDTFTPKIGEDEPIFDQYFQRGWFNHQLDLLSTKHNAEVKYGDASYYENCEPCQRTIEVCSSGVVFADQEQRHQRLNLTCPKPISFG